MLDLNYEPAVLVEDITQLTEKEWLRQRTRGIGGSDVAAVLGISPWKTRRDLFYEKTGVKPLQPDETNWVAKEVGHRLEELVVEIYQRKTGYTVYPIRKIFQHPLYPFMIADVDYLVQKPNGKRGVLECKTSSFMAKDRWADGGVPRHYEVQGKHYLSVTNLDFCAFACLFGNSEGDFLMREIGRDLEEEEMTILELDHFWQDFVAANVEPPYTESGDLVLESIRRYQGKADPSLPQIALASSEVQRLEQFLKLREERDGLEYGDDFLFLSAGQAAEAAQLVLNTYQEAISRQNLLDVQILAPFRSRGECSVKRLNEEIQKLINPPDPHKKEIKYGAQVFRELDKVIQTKNREAVSNGDVGLIVSITQDEEEGNILRVLFSDERAVDYTAEELSQLELAYATTIHKSQGSEYHTVIIPILKNQYIMLRRNLIYTAVSRAKRQVVLVGQKQALYIAIDKNDIDQRNTLLADRIVSYYRQMNAGKRKNSA